MCVSVVLSALGLVVFVFEAFILFLFCLFLFVISGASVFPVCFGSDDERGFHSRHKVGFVFAAAGVVPVAVCAVEVR